MVPQQPCNIQEIEINVKLGNGYLATNGAEEYTAPPECRV